MLITLTTVMVSWIYACDLTHQIIYALKHVQCLYINYTSGNLKKKRKKRKEGKEKEREGRKEQTKREGGGKEEECKKERKKTAVRGGERVFSFQD